MLNLTAHKVTPYGGSTTTTSFTTNAMNEYTAVGGVTHTYTDAGSLEDDGTYLYMYDAHEHLIEVRNEAANAVNATYTYDALGLGRRIGKVVGSDSTRYVHAGVQAIEEYDGTGSGANLRRLYVFGERIDQIVAMEAPDAADVDQDSNTSEVLRFSFHTQLIGSVTQVTAPSGSVAESYEYDPYGKPTIKDAGGSTISASAIGNSYLFTARQFDAETGLYYYRARHYSPDLRRFVQRDPLEYVDGMNVLGYTMAMPASRIDPTGLTVPGRGRQTREPERIFARRSDEPLVEGWHCGFGDAAVIQKESCPHLEWEDLPDGSSAVVGTSQVLGETKGTSIPIHHRSFTLDEVVRTWSAVASVAYEVEFSTEASLKLFGSGIGFKAALTYGATGSAGITGNVSGGHDRWIEWDICTTETPVTTTTTTATTKWQRCKVCKILKYWTQQSTASSESVKQAIVTTFYGTHPYTVTIPLGTKPVVK